MMTTRPNTSAQPTVALAAVAQTSLATLGRRLAFAVTPPEIANNQQFTPFLATARPQLRSASLGNPDAANRICREHLRRSIHALQGPGERVEDRGIELYLTKAGLERRGIGLYLTKTGLERRGIGLYLTKTGLDRRGIGLYLTKTDFIGESNPFLAIKQTLLLTKLLPAC